MSLGHPIVLEIKEGIKRPKDGVCQRDRGRVPRDPSWTNPTNKLNSVGLCYNSKYKINTFKFILV